MVHCDSKVTYNGKLQSSPKNKRGPSGLLPRDATWLLRKKKEIVAKHSDRSERSAHPSWRGVSRGPLKGPWWGTGATPLVGVEGAKPPKLMDFSLLKTHLKGYSGTDFLTFVCLFFIFYTVSHLTW